eukprot:scaffold18515_cov200-Skeletonema_marinoi.AAC.6
MVRVSTFRLASSLKGVKKIAPAARCSLCVPADRVATIPTPLQLRALSTTNEDKEKEPVVLYEGPFASLTLRLKRVSLTSAVIGIVGLPALSFFYGAADSVPATGQVAVIATAGLTAVGSTVLLGYCFSPYVHTLERVAADSAQDKNDQLIRMVTRDILARKVETIFDPTKDVAAPSSSNSRPFCNFMVHGLPFYIHPQMVHDDELRVQLVGEEKQDEVDNKNKTKTDDDEFL